VPHLNDLEDLAAPLEAFEEDTCGVVRNHGQVVKMLGDEVLFVTDQPADAAEIALRLTGPDRDRKGLPRVARRRGCGPGTDQIRRCVRACGQPGRG
jgi:hypothetical protein